MAADGQLEQAIAGVVKLALNLRLLALLLTMVWLPIADATQLPLAAVLLFLTAATSAVALWAWGRIGSWLTSHPMAVLVDVVAAMLILGLVGLDTPFGLFVLATALVAGLLYGPVGAVVMSVALLMSYVGGAVLAGAPPTLAEALGTPVLVPAMAAGGAGLRTLLLRQHDATLALAEAAMSSAADAERARLAREMHDTLAKTLHGIALSATAIPQLAEHDPDRATATARTLADTAGRAADEARALIVDLRTDDLERPLGQVLAEAAQRWGQRTGTAVEIDLDDVCGLSPSVRYELFCIVREALRNAHEHGDARRVGVRLRDGDPVTLEVRDDGRGFAAPEDLASLADAGHFGVVGMSERAATVGGSLELASAPGAGTTVTVTVPRTPSRVADPSPAVPATVATSVGSEQEAAT